MRKIYIDIAGLITASGVKAATGLAKINDIDKKSPMGGNFIN